mmetsp:Transcript_97103/g.163321  ORF Transcript_97103/g.163321 Transcript_97103/m.163321 type:complete len:154 (+) Transcript_97103:1646-2107(+)
MLHMYSGWMQGVAPLVVPKPKWLRFCKLCWIIASHERRHVSATAAEHVHEFFFVVAANARFERSVHGSECVAQTRRHFGQGSGRPKQLDSPKFCHKTLKSKHPLTDAQSFVRCVHRSVFQYQILHKVPTNPCIPRLNKGLQLVVVEVLQWPQG